MSIEERMEAICLGAIQHFGADHQMVKAMEELGECSAAIARMLGESLVPDESDKDIADEVLEGFIEEVVDATVMLCQMAHLAERLSPGCVSDALSDKLDYLELLLPEEFHADE